MRVSSASLVLIASAWCGHVRSQALPTVDLGYAVHQALVYNETYQTYNFTNIRYGQAPVGELRFARPVPPTGRDAGVQDGAVGRICPQARPSWSYISQQFTTALMRGLISMFDYNQAVQNAQKYNLEHPAVQDPRTTEDCLFLDVVVPKAVLENVGAVKNMTSKGAPVMVWIHGGGYVMGSKDQYGPPQGLIKSSQTDGSSGVIYVAINYRLGAFGWLSGPSLQEAGGVSNAGLYDQKLALEWVAQNIGLFGGNGKDITVIGESAGAGSIMHHITANGGQGTVPFQKAILQSPGFFPLTSTYSQDMITQTFLRSLGVQSIGSARTLPSEALILANTMQVGNSAYGQYTYGPAVDGVYVPQLPGLLIQAGAFHKYISVMVGHNSNEGAVFTPPNVQSDEELGTFLHGLFPDIRQPVVDYVVTKLYPYPGGVNGTTNSTTATNGTTSLPYKTGLERTMLLISDVIFTCNTNYVARGFSYMTRNYEFAIPPGFHGQDLVYTFATDRETSYSQAFYKPIADALQGYLTNFAKKGDPNSAQVPPFPVQGEAGNQNLIMPMGITVGVDPTRNPRCRFWQRALYK